MYLQAASALLVTGLLGLGGGEGETEDPDSGLITINLPENITMKFFGRLYMDAGWFSGDSPTYTAFLRPKLEDATEFRTARMGVSGTIYENIDYKLEYDFTPAITQAKDVYVSVKGTRLGAVKLGHFKEPFSLEQLTSSRFITFMERSVANAFSPSRNAGVQLAGSNDSETMTWTGGIFKRTNNQVFGAGDGEYGYTARVTGTPWNDEGESLVHLGGAVSYRTDENVIFATRPEAHLLNLPANTGLIAADSTTLVGLEAAWVNGPFSLQTEYQMASVDVSDGGMDRTFGGYYAFASYFLTGEQRPYKTSSGAFGRIKPSENFGNGTGAMEVALRYSLIDLNDSPTPEEMENVTLGFNWYLNPNTRVMLNWVHSEFDGTPGIDDQADLLMIRFQIDW